MYSFDGLCCRCLHFRTLYPFSAHRPWRGTGRFSSGSSMAGSALISGKLLLSGQASQVTKSCWGEGAPLIPQIKTSLWEDIKHLPMHVWLIHLQMEHCMCRVWILWWQSQWMVEPDLVGRLWVKIDPILPFLSCSRAFKHGVFEVLSCWKREGWFDGEFLTIQEPQVASPVGDH